MINELSVDNIEELRLKFAAAGPFPHVVIDDFLERDVFLAISQEMAEYYGENKEKGKTWNSEAEDGKWGSTGLDLPPNLKALDECLKSQKLIDLLEGISGFKGMRVTADINGVGFSFFHAMKSGSYLGPHTDHTRDLNNGPYHVLNVIIYMADDWDPNWGGGTMIFDRKVRLQSDVEYRPNRALVFMHHPDSIHGTQRISEQAKKLRFSTYYDYYTEDLEPYKHLGLPEVKLLNSPHLFYLPRWTSYLKKENRRYTKMHLGHLKQKVLSFLR